MQRRRRWATLCLMLMAWAISVGAQQRTLCATVGPGRNICVVQAQIRENADGSRVARMHTGWSVVHPVDAFVRADCAAQLLQLLDYRGQAYAAASFDDDSFAAQLGEQMCSTRLR